MTAPPNPLPEGAQSYKRTPSFTEETVPAGLLNDHATKDGTWGLIEVESGRLLYRVIDPRRVPSERLLTPDDPPGIVEPTIVHNVTPVGPVSFHVSFWR
ncbi:DUF1971 domain-containing protein [Sphingomonas montana]|uniref:DUF1971 domain-containing protein n=1 Tax=Sphingomonas montana TaxID=1843236 RepID=UPI00096D370A|nr:DUF1971 domain-containing protein [Sphingomonas montana]